MTNITKRMLNDLKKFWTKILEISKNINDNILQENIQNLLTKSHKWKSPGIDNIPNTWLDTFSSTLGISATRFNEMMLEPTTTPEWFSQSIIYLLSKSHDTENPKNYGSITCLSTFYKLLWLQRSVAYDWYDSSKYSHKAQKTR